MGTFAAGAGHRLLRGTEATWGAGTATEYRRTRHTGCDLDLTKDSLKSNEIRNDRQVADMRMGVGKVTGGFAFELSNKNFDDVIEAALFGSFAAATTTPFAGYAGTLSIAAGTGVITGPSGFTTGMTAGDHVYIAGFSNAANNGFFAVEGFTSTTLTIAAPATPTVAYTGSMAESSVANVAIYSAAKAGTTRKSMVFERGFMDQDTPSYELFAGCMVDSLSLAVKASNMITGQVSMVGKGSTWSTTSTIGTSFDEADYTVSPYDSFNAVIMEGGTLIAVVQSFDFSIKNNVSPAIVVGSKVASGEFAGRIDVTGSLDCYFDSMTMVQKFVNETASSLLLCLGGALGASHSMVLSVPKIKYTGGSVPVNGDGPISLKMPFTSVLDSTTMTSAIVGRMNV